MVSLQLRGNQCAFSIRSLQGLAFQTELIERPLSVGARDADPMLRNREGIARGHPRRAPGAKDVRNPLHGAPLRLKLALEGGENREQQCLFVFLGSSINAVRAVPRGARSVASHAYGNEDEDDAYDDD